MKKLQKLFAFTIAVSVLHLIAVSSGLYAQSTADLVIRNAKVITIDGGNRFAEAIAIKGEFIIAVTSDSDIEHYIEKAKTRVIDAKGRLVVPGFNDAHCHFEGIDPDYIDLRYTTDPRTITEKVTEKVVMAEPGQLIRGGAWEHEMFYDKKWPTKELIDPVSPNNPVVLGRADGHSVLVNSYVIKKSGITKDTPDPFGGEIQKDAVTGEPTGIFREKAQSLLKYGAVEARKTPEQQRRRRIRQWQAAFDSAARLGVTTVQIPSDGFEIYQQFRDMGKLTLRLYIGQPLPSNEKQLRRYIELRKKYPLEDNWIRFGFLKGFIDGTLGSGTALFYEPFEDQPSKSGLSMMTYAELERRIAAADKMEFQIGIHAIGDKANHWVLNAFEKVRQLNGKRDSRHRIEHAQVLALDDIPRFAELAVIASMQPTHCITDKRFAEKRIGRQRCKGAYAWRRLLNADAKIAFGADYPVEPLDPLEGLYAAVTRKDRAGESGPGWFPDQCLTMEEAIKLYTLDSAYAEFMDDRKGIIKKGYLADMVIFRDDLTTIQPEKIMKALVDYTIVGGRVVYKRKGAD
ncbi:MAG: amidohydrolase [Planctomycetes bacterium]|nr:amidohydrolase [Planctomycetota bacterium]